MAERFYLTLFQQEYILNKEYFVNTTKFTEIRSDGALLLSLASLF